MLVKSNVVSINYTKNLKEVSVLMSEYVKHAIRKHINEEGCLTYSWDGYTKDEGHFSMALIKAYGLHVTQVVGGNDVAYVMFMTSGNLGDLFERMNFSRVTVLNINNLTGDRWVKIDEDNLDDIVRRSVIATRVDNENIDVDYFKNELAALKFLGDLY